MASRKSASKRRVAKKAKPRKYQRKAEISGVHLGVGGDAVSIEGMSLNIKPLTLTQRAHAAEQRVERAEAEAERQRKRANDLTTEYDKQINDIGNRQQAELDAKDAEIGYLRATLHRIGFGGTFVTGTTKV